MALRVDDLGRLHWRDLPQESMTLSSSTSSVDSDGYLAYRPLATGRDQQTAYSTRAVATWTASGAWAFAGSPWAAEWRVRRIDGFGLPLAYMGASWATGPWQASAGWLWHEQALSLGAASGHWRVGLAADRLDASAHMRAASLAWQGSW